MTTQGFGRSAIVCVPQLLNPILFDGNVTMYGFNQPVILTDDMQYIHETNYTDEKVDFKYVIGMAFVLLSYVGEKKSCITVCL